MKTKTTVVLAICGGAASAFAPSGLVVLVCILIITWWVLRSQVEAERRLEELERRERMRQAAARHDR